MSWSQWPASGGVPAWPGAVPPSGATMTPTINPLATPGTPYTPEQWATMQQQNWQQWMQWQQQYQQWQQQYGEQYQKSMNALAGQPPTFPVMPVQPPLPIVDQSVTAPLPLPEAKPPLPPDDAPKFNTSVPPPSIPPPPPPQSTESLSNYAQNRQSVLPPSLMSLNVGKPSSYRSDKPPEYGKRSGDFDERFDDAKKNKWENQMEKNQPPKQWNVPPPTQRTQPVPRPNVEELSEAEKNFDKQFEQWEAQFNKWKEQNAGHPDKQQYKEYEAKWESWRTQLLDRREQMRRKRLGLVGSSAGNTPKPSVSPVHISVTASAPASAVASTPALASTLSPTASSEKSTRSSQLETRTEISSRINEKKSEQKPTESLQKDDISILFLQPPKEQRKNIRQRRPSAKSESEVDGNVENTLFKTNTSDGIPGLDLVKDVDDKLPENNVKEVKDVSKDGPDFEAISKGINTILGDQKLLNMLSMVSQNKKPEENAPVLPDKNQDYSNDSYEGEQYSNFNKNSDSNYDDCKINESPGPHFNKNFPQAQEPNNFNHPEQFRGPVIPKLFDGPPKSNDYDEDLRRPNDYNIGPNRPDFNQGPNRRPLEGNIPSLFDNINFNQGPDNFNRRGPNNVNQNNFNEQQSNNFGPNRGYNEMQRDSPFQRGSANEFNRGPLNDFNRGSLNEFSRGPPGNFSQPNREPGSFNSNFPSRGSAPGRNNFDQGPNMNQRQPLLSNRDQWNRPPNFNQGSSNRMPLIQSPPNNFNQGPNRPLLNNFNQGNRSWGPPQRGDFNQGPPRGFNMRDQSESFENRSWGQNDYSEDYPEDTQGYDEEYNEPNDDDNNQEQYNEGEDFEEYDDQKSNDFDKARTDPDGNWNPNSMRRWSDNDKQVPNRSTNYSEKSQYWDEALILKPATVVDYGHRSMNKTETFVEPVQTFDYGHNSKNLGKNSKPDDFSKRNKFNELNYNRRVDNNPPPKINIFNPRRPMSPDEKQTGRRPTPHEENPPGRRPTPQEENQTARRPPLFEEKQGGFNRKGFHSNQQKSETYPLNKEKFERFNNKKFLREPSSERAVKNEKFFNKPNPTKAKEETKSSVTVIEDLLSPPGRNTRPPRIVIILRGPPGSGKTFLAKLIKDKEVEQGGSPPRILSLDDYFMVEQDKEIIEEETGRKTVVKEMVYEYEECMEVSYRQSLERAFKKTVTDGFFPFIILDCINDKAKHFSEMWSFAKQNGFQVYVCQLELDVVACTKRNIHHRSEAEIQRLVTGWEPTPSHYLSLDATSLIQAGCISEVEMEEIIISDDGDNDDNTEVYGMSKWERMEHSGEKLARLDGINKPLRHRTTMEDYLQLEEDEIPEAKPGQKRVRWADLEERRRQDKIRAIGFVVGQTDWDRMMDPTQGGSALTQTKYIERVRRF